MILRAWSGALVDTAEYGWPVVWRVADGWVRYALDRTAPRRCRARSESGRRCWKRDGPHQLHSAPYRVWVELPPRRSDRVRETVLQAAEYRWVEVER